MKVDESTLASYDMTEIGDSNSDDSVEESRRNHQAGKRLLSPDHSHSSTTPLIVDQIPPIIETTRSTSPLSMSEMSDKAKAILNEAFPHISFDAGVKDEDLSKYPDPELSIHASTSSDDDDDEDADDDDDAQSEHTFKGLMIDTSDKENQPSQAAENDEYLVSSPAATKSTSPAAMVQPRSTTKNLAHIFHEELSTLMEEDEGSDDEASVSNDTEESSSTHEDDDGGRQLDMSPMEISIRDRWNHILQLTITGQCADFRAVVDEAEI